MNNRVAQGNGWRSHWREARRWTWVIGWLARSGVVGWQLRLELMRGYQAGDEMREDAGACATLRLDGIRVSQEKGSTET